MMSKKLIRILFILAVLSFNIGCDQVSKSMVRNKVRPFEKIGFLYNHITLQHVENSGAFLSLGDNLSGVLRMLLLNLLPLLAIVAGLIYILIKPGIKVWPLLGIIMIIGGGFGNIYDRIARGSVTDFFHINFVLFQTGIFNVADMSIMAGMFIILIYSWTRKQPEPRKETV